MRESWSRVQKRFSRWHCSCQGRYAGEKQHPRWVHPPWQGDASLGLIPRATFRWQLPIFSQGEEGTTGSQGIATVTAVNVVTRSEKLRGGRVRGGGKGPWKWGQNDKRSSFSSHICVLRSLPSNSLSALQP